MERFALLRTWLQIRGGIHIIFFLLLYKNICCGLSTHNIYFHGEIRKISAFFRMKNLHTCCNGGSLKQLQKWHLVLSILSYLPNLNSVPFCSPSLSKWQLLLMECLALTLFIIHKGQPSSGAFRRLSFVTDHS